MRQRRFSGVVVFGLSEFRLPTRRRRFDVGGLVAQAHHVGRGIGHGVDAPPRRCPCRRCYRWRGGQRRNLLPWGAGTAEGRAVSARCSVAVQAGSSTAAESRPAASSSKEKAFITKRKRTTQSWAALLKRAAWAAGSAAAKLGAAYPPPASRTYQLCPLPVGRGGPTSSRTPSRRRPCSSAGRWARGRR